MIRWRGCAKMSPRKTITYSTGRAHINRVVLPKSPRLDKFIVFVICLKNYYKNYCDNVKNSAYHVNVHRGPVLYSVGTKCVRFCYIRWRFLIVDQAMIKYLPFCRKTGLVFDKRMQKHFHMWDKYGHFFHFRAWFFIFLSGHCIFLKKNTKSPSFSFYATWSSLD